MHPCQIPLSIPCDLELAYYQITNNVTLIANKDQQSALGRKADIHQTKVSASNGTAYGQLQSSPLNAKRQLVYTAAIREVASIKEYP